MITIEWLYWLAGYQPIEWAVGQWIDQLLNCLIASSIDWLIWLYSSLIHLFICSFIVSLTGGGGGGGGGGGQ